MSAKSHGGARPGSGRRPSPYYRKQIVVMVASEDEERAILSLSPRERAEALVSAAKKQ